MSKPLKFEKIWLRPVCKLWHVVGNNSLSTVIYSCPIENKQIKQHKSSRGSKVHFLWCISRWIGCKQPPDTPQAVCEIKNLRWQLDAGYLDMCRVMQRSHSFGMPHPLYAWIISIMHFHHTGLNMQHGLCLLWKRFKSKSVHLRKATRVKCGVDVF